MGTRDDVIEQARRLPAAQLGAAQELLEEIGAITTVVAAPSPHLPGLPKLDRDELEAALVRNEARVWRARQELYDGGLSREEAAVRLGVQPNQVTNLLREGRLFALEGAEGIRLPAWQFHADTRRARLEGLDQVAAAFPGRLLGLSAWMVVANPVLAGRPPREALADGDVDEVVAAAEAAAVR